MSLGAPSTLSMLPLGTLSKQSSRLQKSRRAPRPAPSLGGYGREIVGDSQSEVTVSSTWTVIQHAFD
jgi:hypothetical protein